MFYSTGPWSPSWLACRCGRCMEKRRFCEIENGSGKLRPRTLTINLFTSVSNAAIVIHFHPILIFVGESQILTSYQSPIWGSPRIGQHLNCQNLDYKSFYNCIECRNCAVSVLHFHPILIFVCDSQILPSYQSPIWGSPWIGQHSNCQNLDYKSFYNCIECRNCVVSVIHFYPILIFVGDSQILTSYQSPIWDSPWIGQHPNCQDLDYNFFTTELNAAIILKVYVISILL